MRLTRLRGFRTEEIEHWAQRHLAAASLVVSDGLSCFAGVHNAGCRHTAIVTGGGPGSVTLEAFTWVNTMIGKVKNAIHGTMQSAKNICPGTWLSFAIVSTVDSSSRT